MSIESKILPEYKLELLPMSAEAENAMGFPMSTPDIGKRSRLGGTPGFIQDADWPICPYCREKMTFYAQLDAIGDGYDLADCGLIYVFVCFDCYETKSFVQSY
ncbi:MAG: hypothetical protein LBF56_02885 [Holosporales bacterium]|jgi:hypothetical protein|nr:hypothetical protein [Holosporales bacterium]